MKRDKSNPVAKNLNKYNKPATHTDRKKAMKKGEVKHKKSILKDDEQQTDTSNRTNSAAKKPQNYVDPETGKTKTRMVPVHKDVQTEKLNPSDGIRAYIDDFQKSDAPQFQGKSKEKRREMAIAAYLDAKRGTKKESTDAYGKSQDAIRLKKQKASMTPSDRDKMSRVADMMRREREKRAANKEEVEQEAYNPRAARAQSHAANKMYGRQHPEQDKPKTGVTKQAKSGKAAKADLFRALDKKYGDPKKKTGIYAKEAVDPSDSGGAEEVNMAVKQIAAMHHFLDGIESRVKKAGDMEEWYQNKLTKANDYLKTLYSYGKGDVAEEQDPLLADENPVTENGQDFVVEQEVHARYMRAHGKKASGHGRWAFTTSRHGQSQPGQTFVHTGNFSDAHKKAKKHFGKPVYVMEEVEQVDEASQKLIKKMQDLAGGPDKMPRGAEFRALKKRAQDELKKDSAKKKAAPAPKTTTKTAKGKTHTGRADPADQNIFMQFRKAQDAAKASGRKMHNIKVGPKSTVSVPTSLVNKALAKHDSLNKPEDKRRLKIQLIKALRAKAK